MAMFIVPSELRSKSKLLKYIPDMDYKPLPGLETLTGADVMISPDGLPFPRNDKLILSHIKGGAKLIQIKFGHDLPSSIVDDRLKEALSRMLNTGAMTWQCLLLFVGTIGRDDAKGMATINGQLTYGNQPLLWWYVDQAIGYWIERGGSYYNLPSGRLIPEHFANTQQRLNMHMSKENNERIIWPRAPIFYDEIEPRNPHLKKWKVAQKLIMVDDLRPLLCTIPGARIGHERATAIFDYMKAHNIRMDFMGFLDLVREGDLIKVPGIGEGTLEAVRWGLFRTLEERNEKFTEKAD